MTLLWQDVLVTVIASAAAWAVVQRVRAAFSSSKKSAACEGCEKCGQAEHQ
jgi:hypothetical protein